MKKYLAISAAILMALVSCTKEINPADNDVKLVKMSFNATSADFKTLLGEDMSVSFKAGESIAVFADGVCCKFTTAEGGKNAVFSGEAPEASVYYAVAPYSVAETATINAGQIEGVKLTQGSSWCPKGTYADTKAISVASSTDGNFEFKNICALLKVTVPAEVTDLKEMVFFARNGEAFAGTLSVNPEDASFTVTTKQTQTGAAGVDNNAFAAGTYYIPILPCTCTKGFDVKLTYMDSRVTRGFNGASITIGRNQVINLGTIKDSKEFVYEDFEEGSLPSDVTGNTGALSVVENPFKTSTNLSAYVLKDDMQTRLDGTSGYIQSNTISSVKFPTSMRGQYKRIILKVYMGENDYYPRFVWNKSSSSSMQQRPARLNGVTVSDKTAWAGAVKTNDGNVLEWDASQFGKTTLSDLSSYQLRLYVNWDNGTMTYDAATSNHLVYVDDLSFGL